MNDGKFLRLAGYIFFSIIGFLLAMALLLVAMRLFFGLLSFIPWLTYFYVVFMLSFPAAVFISVFIIYFRRTKTHPSKIVKAISRILFIAFILAWIYVYITDILLFIKIEKPDIEYYLSYNTLFLSLNVTAIFFTGVMQALTMQKEVDWMEKHKRDDY